jgi:hypothetical protein
VEHHQEVQDPVEVQEVVVHQEVRIWFMVHQEVQDQAVLTEHQI